MGWCIKGEAVQEGGREIDVVRFGGQGLPQCSDLKRDKSWAEQSQKWLLTANVGWGVWK